MLEFLLGNAHNDLEMVQHAPTLKQANMKTAGGAKRVAHREPYLTTMITAGGQPITLIEDYRQPWVRRSLGKLVDRERRRN
jgi:hypothetical protein